MINRNIVRQYVEKRGANSSRALGIEIFANLESALIALKNMPKDHKDFDGLHRVIRYKVRKVKGIDLKLQRSGDIGYYFRHHVSNEFFDSDKEQLFEKYTKIFEEEIFKVTGETKGSS